MDNESKYIPLVSLLPSILLLLAIPPIWPYAYYQLLRLVVMICAGYLAYYNYERKEMGWVMVFSFIALLFNPVFPVYLSKSLWAIIDLGAAVVFGMQYLNKTQNQAHNNIKKEGGIK